MKNARNVLLTLILLIVPACDVGSAIATATTVPSSTPQPVATTEPPTATAAPTVTTAPPTPTLSITVTASNYTETDPPQNAVDGDLETIWNSGNNPAQWIQLNLSQPITIAKIRLVISQSPAGMTIHRISAGGPVGGLRLVHEFNGITSTGQVLEFVPPEPLTDIQVIKVETVQSPSWVAWREIEIIRP